MMSTLHELVASKTWEVSLEGFGDGVSGRTENSALGFGFGVRCIPHLGFRMKSGKSA